VQHHLPAGCPLPGYAWIHELADTVVGLAAAGPPTHELWAECSLAFAGIREIPIENLAMSSFRAGRQRKFGCSPRNRHEQRDFHTLPSEASSALTSPTGGMRDACC
jgi:hypothetical protein